MKADESGNVALTYAYADGSYGRFNVKLGKMPLYSNVDDGLVVDDFFSGVQASYGDKFKVLVERQAVGILHMQTKESTLQRTNLPTIRALS